VGAGYIGSLTVVELLGRGESVLILNDLSNGGRRLLDRIEQIAGRMPAFLLDKICRCSRNHPQHHPPRQHSYRQSQLAP
jgi:UDP-glucose 4-epimerase